MKSFKQFILERIASSNSLFHFTTLENFFKIINSNTLKGGGNKRLQDLGSGPFISFTRDVRRSQIPGAGGQGLGFRVDKRKLKSNFSFKPTANEIGNQRGVSKGKQQTDSKFEAEERVFTKEIKNISKFITGIVIPENRKVLKQTPDDVAILLMLFSGAFENSQFSRLTAFDIRGNIIDAVKKMKVPVIVGSQEFEIGKIMVSLKKMFGLKKNGPSEFQKILEKQVKRKVNQFSNNSLVFSTKKFNAQNVSNFKVEK